MQEALIRAWRSRASCATPEAPLPWILQITRNESFRLQERRERRGEREQAGYSDEPGADDPELELLMSNLTVEQVLGGLSEEERILMRLRYVADLSQPEVARRLDLPEGTVKVRLHRIRARLQSVLTPSA